MNPTKRSELRRLPDRGSYEIELIYSIFDAGFLAHIGFEVEGQPFVVPTPYGRDADKLYFHGSSASRMLRMLEAGSPACVTLTLVDGLVLARSGHPSLSKSPTAALNSPAREANSGFLGYICERSVVVIVIESATRFSS